MPSVISFVLPFCGGEEIYGEKLDWIRHDQVKPGGQFLPKLYMTQWSY